MVDIYAVEAGKDCDVIHIWIPADKIPPVPFIEKQLTSQEIALLARQICRNHKVSIAYFNSDIPALLEHLEEIYSYTLSQITDIVLWCGKRISHDKCLELLMKACV